MFTQKTVFIYVTLPAITDEPKIFNGQQNIISFFTHLKYNRQGRGIAHSFIYSGTLMDADLVNILFASQDLAAGLARYFATVYLVSPSFYLLHKFSCHSLISYQAKIYIF